MSLELANDTQKEHHEIAKTGSKLKWTTVVMSNRYLAVTPSIVYQHLLNAMTLPEKWHLRRYAIHACM